MAALLDKLLRLKVDERRAAITCIVAGVVYLIACNTVLLDIDIRWYLFWVLLGPVVCLPFVLTAPARHMNRTEERAAALYDPATDRERMLTVCVAVESDEDRKGES